MKRLGLSEVTVKRFRGIRDQRLVLSKLEGFAPLARGHGNVLLLGDNGSGKSSFVDALEYALRGKLPRIADRGDVNTTTSLCFGDCSPDEVRVELHCCTENGEAPVIAAHGASEDPLDVPEHAREWHTAVRRYPPVLRRSDFVHFIESGGADRMREVARLIGLDAASEVEQRWKALASKLKQDRDHTSAEYRRAKHALVSTAGVASEDDILEEANRRLALLDQAAVESLADLAPMADSSASTETENRSPSRRPPISAIRALVGQAVAALERAGEQHSELIAARDHLSAELSSRGAELIQLLRLGRQLVDQAEPRDRENCPLCESHVPDLVAKLGHRMEALGEAQRRIGAVERHEEALRDELASAATGLDTASSQCAGNNAIPAELERTLQAHAASLRSAMDEMNDPELVRSAIETALETSTSAARTFAELIEAQRGEADERVGAQRWLDRVIPAIERERETDRDAARAKRKHALAKRMVQALDRARSARLTQLSQDLSATITEYYQRLHPGEGHGDLILEHRRRGLHPKSSFHSKEGHPMGFLSEGHLDSLGIAFFLAFIRHYNRDAKLLVLDDVMTTMDSDHRMRLGRLLGEEFQDYQLILTTHDRLWAEQLPRVMRAAGSRMRVIRLRPWMPEEGATLEEFDPQRWRSLAEDVDEDPNGAVARCGVELERFYGAMRTGLALSMRATPGDQYTLGQLQDAFFVWFRKSTHRISHRDHAEHGDFNTWLEEFRGRFQPLTALRNVAGAHYNEWAQSLSAAEARELVELTMQLIDTFTCPRCGSPVEANRQVKAIVCPLCSPKTNYPVFWPFGKKAPEDWPRSPETAGTTETETHPQEPTP